MMRPFEKVDVETSCEGSCVYACRLKVFTEYRRHKIDGVTVTLNRQMKCIGCSNQHVVFELSEGRDERRIGIDHVSCRASNGKSAKFVVVPKEDCSCYRKEDASAVNVSATVKHRIDYAEDSTVVSERKYQLGWWHVVGGLCAITIIHMTDIPGYV